MIENRILDKTVPIPLYYQLKTILNEEISNGSYPPDSPIPTESEISLMFAISLTTVRQAITEMVQEGKLYRLKSKGTFVAHPKINQGFMKQLQSFNDEIAASGRVPSTKVLSLEVVPIPEIMAEYGGLSPTSKSIMLYRKRMADGEPIVRVRTYLAYDECSFLLNHDLEVESMYQVLSASAETKICRVSRICEARAADREDVKILGMRLGQPVHYFNTFGYNANGRLIEYSIAHYVGDSNQFHVDIMLENP